MARRHLVDGSLVHYDLSGSYYAGRRSGLVDYGYCRDGKRGVPQIVYGLLCNAEGCPVAVEVFQGNTRDSKTLGRQITNVCHRSGTPRVVFVGDRGMITSKRIDEDMRHVDGLDWITALHADNIKKLASQKIIEPSLFNESNVAVMGCLQEHISLVEGAVYGQVRLPKSYRRLTSVPGIGKILALTIMLETGDIDRFDDVGHCVSYGRLVGSSYVSNGKRKG